MISQNEIQSLYMDLYRSIRKYLWPFNTVVHIADLEIECYKAFPDIELLRDRLKVLSSDVASVSREDEELNDALEAFSDALNNVTTVYNKLNKFEEVVV